VRLGGQIIGIAPASTVIALTLDEWRHATGITFDQSGPTKAPGALVPIHVNIAHDYGVYVEPAVWMSHELCVHHRVDPEVVTPHQRSV